jgi:RNA polymerase sigma-70 factor (ECF subfamily)
MAHTGKDYKTYILLQIFTKIYGRWDCGTTFISDNNHGAGMTAMSESEFHRLVEGQIPRLRRYARALTRDSTRADDLMQDTLVRGLAKAHLWQVDTDIRAWLFTIMHNQYVNNVRRAQREGATVDVDQMASTLVATTDPIARRQLSEVDRALGHLSKGQREVVLLVGLEGMSYDEAAKILRVPIGTVRSRLGRAREALRARLGFGEETESVSRAARCRAADRDIAA